MGIGVGAVCRDESGAVSWGITLQRRELLEPDEAEAVAILSGLHEACNVRIKSVTMESDCATVIHGLRQKRKRKGLLFLIYEDIYLLCNSFDNISWSKVRRTANKVAHNLVDVLSWEVGRPSWEHDFPLNVANDVAADLEVMN
ncbi:uncharacterized protein LOC141601925 [Silene latifolia]|uniref:uncharacterized protein LOC141601925 n=1 Tax=Silene latifolia TaxID=37657 RepID=UPI003D7812AE